MHIFTPAAREFYRLENLWGEAPGRRWSGDSARFDRLVSSTVQLRGLYSAGAPLGEAVRKCYLAPSLPRCQIGATPHRGSEGQHRRERLQVDALFSPDEAAKLRLCGVWPDGRGLPLRPESSIGGVPRGRSVAQALAPRGAMRRWFTRRRGRRGRCHPLKPVADSCRRTRRTVCAAPRNRRAALTPTLEPGRTLRTPRDLGQLLLRAARAWCEVLLPPEPHHHAADGCVRVPGVHLQVRGLAHAASRAARLSSHD